MRHVVPLALLLLLPLRAGAAEPKVEEFAPHAAGVALVEVTKVEKFDGRSVDGPAGVRFHLKRVRGTGAIPEYVEVITELGGLQPPGFVFKPSLPVKSDSLKKGERWWFAFSSEHDWDKHNEGVIGFWPEKDAKADALDAAVKADAYRWHPQYDPQTKFTYGRISEKDKWIVRVEKDGKELWRKEISGKPVVESPMYGLWDNTGGDLEVKMPKCGKILLADTRTRLAKDNEFGLPAGPYWINNGFDPETGKRLASWVQRPQVSHVALVDRRYDPESGKPEFEQRYDFLKAGGKAAGAKTEDWFRKIERTFDAGGKVTKEEVFRYDDTADAGNRWVKVK